MDFVVLVIFGVLIITFALALLRHLDKISKHLKAVRLQLEIQNPLFVSEQLLELDKNINYWHGKMWKYKDETDDKYKEISEVTFNLFWEYVDRLNHYRIMIVESKKTGEPTKIHEKYEKWLTTNQEEIRKMEEKAMALDEKIKDEISKRNLDIEFLGKWNKDES